MKQLKDDARTSLTTNIKTYERGVVNDSGNVGSASMTKTRFHKTTNIE